MKINKRYMIFASIIVCLILNVVLTVRMQSDGLVLSKLEGDIEEARQIEKTLRYTLISNSSLTKTQEYAEEHDFVAPDDIVYVKDGFTGLAKLP